MTKRTDSNTKKCSLCGNEFEPNSVRQMYCAECKRIRRKEAIERYNAKKYPNKKPKVKCKEICCACGGEFAAWFDGKPYCNKHYLRMYNNGDLLLHPRGKTNKYEIKGDVLEVRTSSGDVFICDAEDKEKVEKHSWCKNKSGGYLVANINGKIKRLSRFILDLEDRGLVVDHINGDVNDNRKSNLRTCTRKDNSRNCKKQKSKTGITGVREKENGTYAARITVDRKELHLGTYKSIQDAEKARIAAEIQYYGEFSPHMSRCGQSHPEICE